MMKHFDDTQKEYDIITQIYDDNTNLDEYINIVDTHISHTSTNTNTQNHDKNNTNIYNTNPDANPKANPNITTHIYAEKDKGKDDDEAIKGKGLCPDTQNSPESSTLNPIRQILMGGLQGGEEGDAHTPIDSNVDVYDDADYS